MQFKATYFVDGQSMDDSERHDFNLPLFLTDLLMGDAFFEWFLDIVFIYSWLYECDHIVLLSDCDFCDMYI